MKIKKGMRVKLANLNNRFGGTFAQTKSNTVGNTGVVTKAGADCFAVSWDNGSSNSYHQHNLQPLAMENV